MALSEIISLASYAGMIKGAQGVASAAVGPTMALTDAITLGGASESATALALAYNFAEGHVQSAFATTIAAIIAKQGCKFIRPTLLKVMSTICG